MSSLQVQVAQPQDESMTSAPAAAPQPVAMSWWRLLPAVLFCLDLLRLRVLLLLAPLPINDFLVYWASGRLFLTGANPYSVPAIFAIERSIGWPFTHPMSLLYPPWSFPFVALFGVFSFHTAQYAWLAVSLVLEAISAVALWRYFGGEKSKQWIALVLFATFLPIGSAEQMGQITPLILAGLTAFLFLLRRQRYLLAGACLLTLGLKPHLIYLVLLAFCFGPSRPGDGRLPSVPSSSMPVPPLPRSPLTAMFSIVFMAQCMMPWIFPRRGRGVALHLWNAAHMASVSPHGDWDCMVRALLDQEPSRLDVGRASPAASAGFSRHVPPFLGHDYILALPSFAALTVAISRTRTDWLVASGLYLVVQYIC